LAKEMDKLKTVTLRRSLIGTKRNRVQLWKELYNSSL
jgi:hypothetical protein